VGHSHEAKAPEPAKKEAPAKASVNEPIILGVGVPASEL
jgi:ribonuclease E